MKVLRKIISLILREYQESPVDEKDIIGEPDLTNSEQRKAAVRKKKKKRKNRKKLEISAGGVAGVATPLGTGPNYPAKIKKKSKRRK